MSNETLNFVKMPDKTIRVGFDMIWPIGVTYTQYPGQKSPMDLWGEFSTWEPINYNGAFFRATGGNANPWIEVTTTDGKNFTVKAGCVVPASSVLRSGATVMFNGESRVVGGTGGGENVDTFWLNSAFTQPDGGYENMTNVYILQNQGTAKNGLKIEVKDLGHTHGYVEWTGGTAGFGGGGTPTTKRTSQSDSGTANISSSISSDDSETRPINLTYIVWLRTA